MAISGIVLTLAGDPTAADQAIRVMSADPRLTLGERAGSQLPAVLETGSPSEDEEAWSWIRALPGVQSLKLAFVDLAPDGEKDAS